MKSNPNRLWMVAIALGWLFDFLFWKHAARHQLCHLRCAVPRGRDVPSAGRGKDAARARRPLAVDPHPVFRDRHLRPRRAADLLPRPFPDPVPARRFRHHLSGRTLDLVRAVGLRDGLSQVGREHARQAADVCRGSPQGTRRARRPAQTFRVARGARIADRPAHRRHLRVPALLRRRGLRARGSRIFSIF